MRAAISVTSCSRGRGAGSAVGRRELRGAAHRGLQSRIVVRVHEHARLRRDEFGRAADGGCDDASLHRHRLQGGLPEGLDLRRLTENVARGDPAGHLGLRNAAHQLHVRAALELLAQRSVPDEGQSALAQPRESVREADHVLALDQRADAEIRAPVRRLRPPAELTARRLSVHRRKGLEVHAAVGDRELLARGGDVVAEALCQPRGIGDDGGRPGDDALGGDRDPRHPSQVGHVLAVSHDDEGATGRSGRRRAREARGEEKVREHDVGAKPPCGSDRVASEPQVLGRRSSAATERRDLDRVAGPLEPLDQGHEEAPEVGLAIARPHLCDEQDSHSGELGVVADAGSHDCGRGLAREGTGCAKIARYVTTPKDRQWRA